MDIKWMEEIAAHLGRIAGAHERVAGALAQIAKSTEVASVDRALSAFGEREGLRYRNLGDSLRDTVNQLVREHAGRKSEDGK